MTTAAANEQQQTLKEALSDLSELALVDEREFIEILLESMSDVEEKHPAIAAKAGKVIDALRSQDDTDMVQSFFQQYPLSSVQGMALMRLAEALLRIPDEETANDLIHDTLTGVDWKNYGTPNDSLLVNASSKGLQLASSVFGMGKTVQTIADPIIRRFIKKTMQETGHHFVMGETIEKAIFRSSKYDKEGYIFSYDMLGEAARSEKQAKAFFDAYLHAIEALGKQADPEKNIHQRQGISIKLSALYPRYELLKKHDVYEHLLPRIKALIVEARKQNVPVTIDAEEAARLDLSLELFADILADDKLKGWNGLGLAVQAYQKRALSVIDYVAQVAQETGHNIPVRLVKGAYWDAEIKEAQMEGLEGYPVFTEKVFTDACYIACAKKMFEYSEEIYPQFATHNAYSMAAVEVLADGKPFEYQLLHGMGQGLYKPVVGKGIPCRIYAPVGPYTELLPYLIRRLLENGANNAFIKVISDENVPVAELVQSPLVQAKEMLELGQKEQKIVLPDEIYGLDRVNSRGLDLGSAYEIDSLQEKLEPYLNKKWEAKSVIGKERVSGTVRTVTSPYNDKIEVGKVHNCKAEDIAKAMDVAAHGFAVWDSTTAEHRAKILENIAHKLEENTTELIALCMQEAGKTLHDAIAEIREAVDFCRYYANEAILKFSVAQRLSSPAGETNELSLHGRGVFLCISPWNFPLAIFTGQVTAALAAGNSVIAKPADTTSLVACRAVELMIQAGVPEGVVNVVLARGAEVSKQLLPDNRLSGVAFTGSNATARILNRALADREGPIIPLIAETGGQNCMIVDSSALLERVVDDVVDSAFSSAGQRCSALRVLYIQHDVADEFIELLQGAMQELKVGNPVNFSTDVGPVIDASAKGTLEAHIAKMTKAHKLIAVKHPDDEILLEHGLFVSPHAFEINSIADLSEEVFGPVLHIIRYKHSKLKNVIAEINSTGFGLTFGMHSRIDRKILDVSRKVRAGNHYINRNMIGAVVGVQPFGGEGLSGTGPKAGGPHYLYRFASERVETINTAAIGGDIELLT